MPLLQSTFTIEVASINRYTRAKVQLVVGITEPIQVS